ncbi:MAG: DUF3500 domain-containing protein [Thermomicrobiales bacterium]|nr:DUF3500 domain-containing protein [Thermomicrobiales bacterium]
MSTIKPTSPGWIKRIGMVLPYWRVADEAIIVEYSPQDQLTDDPRDHIHAIYRDPSNEYGIRYQ